MSAAPPPGGVNRGGSLRRLAAWSYAHRRRVLAAWLVGLVGVTGAASAFGSDYRNDFSLPGTESQRASDALAERAPARAGDSVQIVLAERAGLARPAVRERVGSMLAEVSGLPHVVAVTDPYRDPATLSGDEAIGFATVTLDGRATEVPKEAVVELIETAQAAAGDGLRVELGGDAVRDAEESGGGAAEGLGMLAALAILVVLFGSLVAAALPLMTAVFAVGSTLGLIVLASHLSDFADFTPPLMMLVGLGVGIDYALLIFARYRDELLGGAGAAEAVQTALATAGRSVLFAGATVMFALLGLYALGLASLQGVALAVALTVLMTLLAALTLLPALLHLLGPQLERRIRRRAERGERGESTGGERWRRWSAWVQRHPWPALALSVAALVALSLPALGMRLGFVDAGTDPGASTSRQAYDLLAEGFGPGFNAPLLVVAEGSEADGERLASLLARTPGVAAAEQTGSEGGLVTVMTFPGSKPQDAETDALVGHLRESVLPPLAAETGATFLVGGPTAAAADFTDKVNARMPLFLLVVVGLSTLLLTAIFRSLLIPLKAAILNLLTIGAALGVITLAFGGSGPIESFVPVMIFAIVFGLSMDYEVFLISRMHEEWQRSGDAPRAIAVGMATTGRVITAAAAIMIVVFGAFVLSPERMLQQFGLGLAVAIAIDAFVVRCLIVPAAMQVLGPRAWWLPAPLARRLPHLPAVEPEGPSDPTA